MKNAIILTISILLIVIGLGFYANNKKAEKPIVNTSAVLEVTEQDHLEGDSQSKVVLVEYLDFQCPACAAYHALLKTVKEQNKDIAIVTRHFPLPFHKNAFKASYAAEAASKQGKFSEMADKLFTNQKDWQSVGDPEQLFIAYASEIGLDISTFASDINSSEVIDRVENDRNQGLAIGVNATPTFYIQGERVTNLRTADDFQKLIDAAKEATAGETIEL